MTQEAIARSQGKELDWGNLFNDLKYQLTGDKDNPLSAEESFEREIETFDKDDYDTFMQDEIIKATMSDLEEVPEKTGPGWNPNGLTNLLQDQIGFINELTAAGILNVNDARAATEQRLDEVWGELQAGFQSELDDLVAGDAAAAASLGATTDSIAADLRGALWKK